MAPLAAAAGRAARSALAPDPVRHRDRDAPVSGLDEYLWNAMADAAQRAMVVCRHPLHRGSLDLAGVRCRCLGVAAACTAAPGTKRAGNCGGVHLGHGTPDERLASRRAVGARGTKRDR